MRFSPSQHDQQVVFLCGDDVVLFPKTTIDTSVMQSVFLPLREEKFGFMMFASYCCDGTSTSRAESDKIGSQRNEEQTLVIEVVDIRKLCTIEAKCSTAVQ